MGPCVLALLAAGCADVVDTELGLDATIDAASVTVSGDAVSGTFEVTYRVGEFAEGTRSFQPQGISLFVDEVIVGTVIVEAPPDFEPSVAPGESRQVTLSGDAVGVTEPSRLCGATVTLVFMWTDRSTGEMGMVEATTGDVSCG